MVKRPFEESGGEEAFVGSCCVIHTRDETVVKKGKKKQTQGTEGDILTMLKSPQIGRQGKNHHLILSMR